MRTNKLIFLFLGLISLFVAGYFFLSNWNKSEEQVLENTYDISKEYLLLRLKSDEILVNAEDYSDYAAWNEDMSTLIMEWENLDKKSQEIENSATELAEKVAINFELIQTANAYTAKEITAIYDKAPKFKGIATLAKHLRVDAKKAQLILNQAQDATTVEGWTEAGDTFENLENSAIVIKDGCKVAGFVGTVVATGGAAGFAAAGTATQVGTVIVGVDLALEVTDDGAQIALGDKNKVSSFVKGVRTVTEPIADVINITNVPSNLGTSFGRFQSAMVGLEEFRESAQEGKVIGIDLRNFKYEPPFQVIKQTKYPGEVTVAEMEKAEVEEWLKNLNVKQEPMSREEINEFLESSSKQSEPRVKVTSNEGDNKTTEESNKKAENSDSGLAGTGWQGTLSSMSGGDNQKRTIDFDFTLNNDGSVNGKSFKKWAQTGDRIKVYGEDETLGYYEFKPFGNNELQLTKIVIGDEIIQPGEEYMGGIAPGGFLQKKSGSQADDSSTSKDAIPYAEFTETDDKGLLDNISGVESYLGQPDVKTTDDKGRIIYVYYDAVKYDSGNLGSVRMSFYNEDDYRSYVEGTGGSWDSNKETWDESGGGIRATSEIKSAETFKKIYEK